MPISEARDRLGEVVSRAEHGQERTVLTRHGKPVAVVISVDDLRELEAAEDEADLEAARGALADPVRVPNVSVSVELLGFQLTRDWTATEAPPKVIPEVM